jgi:signal transduction histidine kinase
LDRELVAAFNSGPEPPLSQPHRQFWLMRVRSFAHLFGAAALGCGLLTWAVRNVSEPAVQTSAALSLFAMNALIGGFALVPEYMFHQKAYGVLSAVFFVLTLGWCWCLVLRLERTEEEEEEANAVQQERNRLARELHDSIKQQLFSINISAATTQARWENDEPGARGALADVRNSVREAMAEMEALLHNLRPVPVETVGLIEALRQQCEALQYRTGAQVIAEIGDLPSHEELPPGTQDAIFRVTQEALANIARHARASKVRVRLYQQVRGSQDALWLKIEDDGSGFDAAKATAGMGLTNIRARVAGVGGSLQIESREGEGASLVVRVPLAISESDTLKRDLHVAFAFALIGALIGGGELYFFVRLYWLVMALPLLLSAFLCYRVGKALRLRRTTATAKSKKVWDLEIYWRQVRLVLQAMTAWVALRWSISAYSQSSTKQMVFGIVVLLLWLPLYIYEMIRISHLIKLQRVALAPPAVRRNLMRLWRQASFAVLLALPFIGRLSLLWFDGSFHWFWERTSIPFTLALLFYWFYLTGCQLWQRRQGGEKL